MVDLHKSRWPNAVVLRLENVEFVKKEGQPAP